MQNQAPKNWQKVKLGEVVNVYGGGTPSTQNQSYWNGDIPWLTPAELTNYENRSIAGTASYITQSGLQNSSAKIMPENSVLLTSRATIGAAVINTIPMATNQGFINIEPKKVDRDFFYYWLKSKKKYLNQIAVGSTFPELSKSVFKEIETEIPINVEDQKKVAAILSAFDDKIEVNNKIAKTLEEMTQALFKEWFVHFRFPGYEKTEFVDSELGKIPKGWQVGLIKKLGKVVTGKTPSTEIKENFGSEFPFITIPDINSVFITKTERYLSEKGVEKMKSMLLPARSICVSCIATVGLVGISTQQSLTNQQVNSIIPNEEELTYFLYLYFKSKKKDLELFGSGGTATLIINKTKFENLDLVIPVENILKNFHSTVKPMYEKILNITRENQKLAALRDLLLPKLMKGEIRV